MKKPKLKTALTFDKMTIFKFDTYQIVKGGSNVGNGNDTGNGQATIDVPPPLSTDCSK